jgi:hypothetical protein
MEQRDKFRAIKVRASRPNSAKQYEGHSDGYNSSENDTNLSGYRGAQTARLNNRYTSESTQRQRLGKSKPRLRDALHHQTQRASSIPHNDVPIHEVHQSQQENLRYKSPSLQLDLSHLTLSRNKTREDEWKTTSSKSSMKYGIHAVHEKDHFSNTNEWELDLNEVQKKRVTKILKRELLVQSSAVVKGLLQGGHIWPGFGMDLLHAHGDIMDELITFLKDGDQ